MKKAFYALMPGRQRGYLLHILSANQAKTSEDRLQRPWKGS
ncbi:MAG: YdeI/OmpD-associated family protein [Flavobacteriales bacterium]